jgi:hypothetical protein
MSNEENVMTSHAPNWNVTPPQIRRINRLSDTSRISNRWGKYWLKTLNIAA